MKACKSAASVQKLAALGIVVCGMALTGCAKQRSTTTAGTIRLDGAYIEHTTGKSYALVFDGSQVSVWMYYPDKGPVIRSSIYEVCLTKGATFTVTGESVKISGGSPANAGAQAAAFPIPGTGQDTTLQMVSHGFVLQLPVNGGKSLNFVKSV